MGAKVSTNSWNVNFRNTMGYPDWYVQIVDVPNEDTWQIFTIIECTYNFNWAGKPWVLKDWQLVPSKGYVLNKGAVTMFSGDGEIGKKEIETDTEQ